MIYLIMYQVTNMESLTDACCLTSFRVLEMLALYVYNVAEKLMTFFSSTEDTCDTCSTMNK